MISDAIVDAGRERGAESPFPVSCRAVQSAQATMQSLSRCLSSGEIPPHHCPPVPSILSTMLSSLPMPRNSVLFPWPQLNPAQRISLTCYVGLSMGVDSSSLHEGTKGCSKQALPCPHSAPILVSVLLSPDCRQQTTHQCELTFNYDPDVMPIITI